MGLRLRNSPSDVFEGRDAPPMHYSLKISSFSKASVDKYMSDEFEAGDYKWRLSIYPIGKTEGDGKGHISISLTLVDTALLPVGWEVKALFNLLVFDQVHDIYYSLSDGKVRRFHAMKTEWGIAKFIELEIFTDSSNGYLIDDTCVFGVDIFVLKQSRKGECLSIMEEPVTNSHTWKIKVSALNLERYESAAFVVGDYKWRIRLYPRGSGVGKGNSMSAFLTLDESILPPDTRLFAKFILRVMDQNQTKSEHFESKCEQHFGPSCLAWGAQKFMPIAKLSDLKKGYLVEDTLIIEAQVTLLGIVSATF